MQMTHHLSHPDSTLQTFLPPNPNFSPQLLYLQNTISEDSPVPSNLKTL